MEKVYTIKLDGIIIGQSLLENGDPPMGVVSGRLNFINIESGYDFFNQYCTKNAVVINSDFPDERLIDTQIIPELRVYNEIGREIVGSFGNSISGMDSDVFEITILGLQYPDYEIEFPHHVKSYEGK
jgi:hypothetical protein